MTENLPINRPLVAVAAKRTPLVPAMITLLLIGVAIFFWLSSARAAQQQADGGLPPLNAPASGAAAPVELKSRKLAEQPSAPDLFIANSPPQPEREIAPTGYAMSPAPVRTVSSGSSDRLRERMRAPTLIVDLAQADIPGPPGAPDARSDSGAPGSAYPQPGTAGAPAGSTSAAAANRDLSDTERFSARVSGEDSKAAQAHQMVNLDRLVPQGAVIGAVMETALNSDLPGYARAIIQRDVYSFDGSAVLIPAGSKLIGQYKSGVAQGASRLFLVWTRLIRPDGVTIDLASPVTDDLGRGGIGGKVNRHFFQRFGGAILTSVLSGGINAAAAALSGGSTIIVGSAGQASSLASQATQSTDIPPTITTKQGASVRVFVARDLDFSHVRPAL